ncbi:MAG: hypothetical protein N3A72_07085 [bacterium]|nr:hypothetical protein [bacterium]
MMTPEEKGRILLEFEECKKELTERRLELEKAGEILGLFASLLQREPESIILPSQDEKQYNVAKETEQYINIDYFRRATQAIRALVTRYESLEKKKREIGF